MVLIHRKEGWSLNPSDKVVNSILKMIERNKGLCPCSHDDKDGDTHCPCDSYRLRDECVCGLYVKTPDNA